MFMKNKSWIKILLIPIFLICFDVIGNAQTSAPLLNQYLHRDTDSQNDVEKFPRVKDQVAVMSDSIAQKEPKEIEKRGTEAIFDAIVVQNPAEFPGGQSALMKWLSNNIRYPEAAHRNKIQGIVTIKFVIEKDGSVSGVSVLKGVDKDLDAEAIRVVKRMPKWKPAWDGGQVVRSYFTLPITFKLQNQ